MKDRRWNITINYYDKNYKEDVKLRYYNQTDENLKYLTKECQRLGLEITSQEVK